MKKAGVFLLLYAIVECLFKGPLYLWIKLGISNNHGLVNFLDATPVIIKLWWACSFIIPLMLIFFSLSLLSNKKSEFIHFMLSASSVLYLLISFALLLDPYKGHPSYFLCDALGLSIDIACLSSFILISSYFMKNKTNFILPKSLLLFGITLSLVYAYFFYNLGKNSQILWVGGFWNLEKVLGSWGGMVKESETVSEIPKIVYWKVYLHIVPTLLLIAAVLTLKPKESSEELEK